jgi:hypothetical protein
MYILTIEGKSNERAYATPNKNGDQVLYIFEEKDDAYRFSLMLENDGYIKLNVTEVDEDLILEACEFNSYEYAIITKNDLVIPPNINHDFI